MTLASCASLCGERFLGVQYSSEYNEIKKNSWVTSLYLVSGRWGPPPCVFVHLRSIPQFSVFSCSVFGFWCRSCLEVTFWGCSCEALDVHQKSFQLLFLKLTYLEPIFLVGVLKIVFGHFIHAVVSPLITKARLDGWISRISPRHMDCSGSSARDADELRDLRVGMNALDHLQSHKVVDVVTCSDVKKDLVLAYVGERQRRAAFADQVTKSRDKHKTYPPGARHTIQKLRNEVRALKSIRVTSNLASRKISLS